MSYCRFSTDDFACDLYIYESSEGFVTHVAASRVVGDIPKIPPYSLLREDVGAWSVAYNEQSRFVMTAEREAIHLPHAGETFVDGDVDSIVVRLTELRALGYRFPDHVIESLKEEAEAERADEAEAAQVS